MTKENLKTSFIPRSNELYALIEAFCKRTVCGDEYHKDRFTVKDTGLSSRVVSHWAEKGLLPDGLKGEVGWRKFTITEMVWLKIAIQLRDFGFPLDKIVSIKKQIMIFNRENKTYPILDCYISQACLDYDVYVVILTDGRADIATALELELAKRDLSFLRKSMFLISLKSILLELGLPVQKAKISVPLNTEEVELYKSLSKENKEVRAVISEGKIKEIETKSIVSESPDVGQINRRISEGQEYAELVTKYSGGVIQSAEIKKRRRFR